MYLLFVFLCIHANFITMEFLWYCLLYAIMYIFGCFLILGGFAYSNQELAAILGQFNLYFNAKVNEVVQ